MNLVKVLIVLAFVGFGYQYWNKHHQDRTATIGASSIQSHNGFVDLPAVAGAGTGTVIVIAAENCPEQAAQRADYMAEQLRHDRIPVTRLHSVSFDIQNGDSAIAARVMEIMNGELPIVLVHGKAKSNPTVEEVIDEYRSGV